MWTDDIETQTLKLSRLRVRVAQLEAAAAPRNTDAFDSGFKQGDRVKIENKVKRPANWKNDVAWDQTAAQSLQGSSAFPYR